ncbi:hypothetical protein P7C70_g8782, partial [Phenoliferia sp. Uapishka_3]
MLLLLLLPLASIAIGSQIPLSAPTHSPRSWTHVGPLPLGTHEGPLLPPLYPDLKLEKHSSPLADGGYVYAREVVEDLDGWVQVGDGEPQIRWNALRSTAGWSILQHQRFYTTTLLVPTSSSPTTTYAISLFTGAEFSIRKKTSMDKRTRWYNGNMYSYPHTAPHFIPLNSGQEYEITVTYHHDMRIAGEAREDGVPVGRWRLSLERVEEERVRFEEQGCVVPGVLRGVVLGKVVGIELRNPSPKSVEIVSVNTIGEEVRCLQRFPIFVYRNDILPPQISLSLVNRTMLAPYQSLLLPLHLTQTQLLHTNSSLSHHSIPLILSLSPSNPLFSSTYNLSLTLSLPLSPPRGPLLSTFLSNTQTPSYSLYTPPKRVDTKDPGTILGLHGAGVDPATSTEWTMQSVPQRESEWMVWPIGLTAWGYDWHGGSLRDAKLAVKNLEVVKELWAKAMSLQYSPSDEGEEKRSAVFGHSNGGQGAWYYMSHFPDEVLGGVPASGYVKIQDYVPYNFAIGRHYRDSALTGVMDSSLSQFDNDLHASNLAGLPILSRHGGDDDNVAVQHSRQLVGIVERWAGNASAITYSEVPGAGHWFDGVFDSPLVKTFFDSLFAKNATLPTKEDFEFTLTVANPDDSGSMNGFKIVELEIPGRLARITVRIFPDQITGASSASLRTRNVRSFSINQTILASRLGVTLSSLIVNHLPPTSLLPGNSLQSFTLDSKTIQSFSTAIRARRYGPLLSILSSPSPLQIIIGTTGSKETTEHLESIATRIAHDALVYGKISSVVRRDR